MESSRISHCSAYKTLPLTVFEHLHVSPSPLGYRDKEVSLPGTEPDRAQI